MSVGALNMEPYLTSSDFFRLAVEVPPFIDSIYFTTSPLHISNQDQGAYYRNHITDLVSRGLCWAGCVHDMGLLVVWFLCPGGVGGINQRTVSKMVRPLAAAGRR